MSDPKDDVFSMLKRAGAVQVRTGKHEIWRIPGSKIQHTLSRTSGNPRAWKNARARIVRDATSLGIKLGERAKKISKAFEPRTVEEKHVPTLEMTYETLHPEVEQIADVSSSLPAPEQSIRYEVRDVIAESVPPGPPDLVVVKRPFESARIIRADSLPPSCHGIDVTHTTGSAATSGSMLERAALYKRSVKREHREPPQPVFHYSAEDIRHADYLQRTQGKSVAEKFLYERKHNMVTPVHGQSTAPANPSSALGGIRQAIEQLRREVSDRLDAIANLEKTLTLMGYPVTPQTSTEPPLKPHRPHAKTGVWKLAMDEMVVALKNNSGPMVKREMIAMARTNPDLAAKPEQSFTDALYFEMKAEKPRIKRLAAGLYDLVDRGQP